VAAVAALAGCGGDAPAEVGAGQAPSPATASTTTTVAAAGAPGPSPVAGLDAAQLQAAVAAAPPPAGRRVTGPVAEPITLEDGRTVWRVRIPGSFPARSAQVSVAVGGRDLGPAVTPPTLDALVVVTTDARGLTAGAPVTYRWGSEPAVAAGPLEVVR